jgi:hypothetical protein
MPLLLPPRLWIDVPCHVCYIPAHMCARALHCVCMAHTCIDTYIHAYIHTCIHTCIHTYIHTYIYTQLPSQRRREHVHTARPSRNRFHRRCVCPTQGHRHVCSLHGVCFFFFVKLRVLSGERHAVTFPEYTKIHVYSCDFRGNCAAVYEGVKSYCAWCMHACMYNTRVRAGCYDMRLK